VVLLIGATVGAMRVNVRAVIRRGAAIHDLDDQPEEFR
jgi:hypothetical protein